MFMGDFLQLPPITDTPLYFINIQLKKEFTLTKSTQKKVISKSLWEITP
jgi:hypothetical protein